LGAGILLSVVEEGDFSGSARPSGGHIKKILLISDLYFGGGGKVLCLRDFTSSSNALKRISNLLTYPSRDSNLFLSAESQIAAGIMAITPIM
jgi:hypothetical protein